MSHDENMSKHKIYDDDTPYVKIAKLRDYITDQAMLYPPRSLDRKYRLMISHMMSDTLSDLYGNTKNVDIIVSDMLRRKYILDVQLLGTNGLSIPEEIYMSSILKGLIYNETEEETKTGSEVHIT